MKTTTTKKCDACHKVRKLYFFRNQADSGYVAYCDDCATYMGYQQRFTEKV